MSIILFEASTHSAYAIKILIDTLNFYLKKKGSFVINSKGIFLCNTNEKEDVLCDVKLLSENFEEFKCNRPGDICFSINLNTLYNDMLKKFKKKDYIRLQILEENGKMFLKITKDNPEGRGSNQISTKAPIIESRHIPIDPPKDYDHPITIISKAFTSSCREIAKPTSKEMEITCYNGKLLKFFACKDDTVENEVTLGKIDDSSILCETFRSKCSASYVTRPAKLAGLAETVKIFVKDGLPLYYKINLGSLGEISIYIKTIEQVQLENASDSE